MDYSVMANYTNTSADNIDLDLEGSTDGYGDAPNAAYIRYPGYRSAFLAGRKRFVKDNQNTGSNNDEF